MTEALAFLESRVEPKFDVRALLFGKQRAFVEDEAPFSTASCTRRAGKTVGIATWLLEGPLQRPEAPSLYFTISRKEAKRIVWPVMLRINRERRLGYEPNEADLILKLNGVPSVFLMGVNTKDEIDKARGTGWGRVAGDEAQTLPGYVEDMVNDVLMPSFMDHDGKLRLIGTPGAVPVGYFHDTVQNAQWTHHEWSVWENPHLPNARAMLEKVLKARGVKESDPSIQREWFGRWVYDPDSLVFRWTEANHYDEQPHLTSFCFGVDLGWEDADAIAVIGWSDASPNAYLVEESVEAKQTISALTDRLAKLVAKYNPISIVVDYGGLGKKIAEEVTARTTLPLKAAEKTRKFEFIELLNDAMRTGRFYARKDSRFAHDAMLVEWDKEKSKSDRLVVSERFHSDIGDGVLYAYREALHWLYEPLEPKKPVRGHPARFAEEEAEYIAAMEREIQEKKLEEAQLWQGEW